MVFRRRRQNALRPINRIKHVIDLQAGLVLGNVQTTILAIGSDSPTLAVTTECETGSTINGIYLNVEAYATTASALSNVYLIVTKNPGNNLTLPQPNLVGSNNNKKYVIHQEMKMLERSVNGNPRTIFNGVIVIPRGYRRMGPNDTINVALFAPGVNIDFCLQCHYKEFQ